MSDREAVGWPSVPETSHRGSKLGGWTLTLRVAEDGLLDVVLLQRQVGQLHPLLAVAGVEMGGDQAELQGFLHVPQVLVDHGQGGEGLVGQWSWEGGVKDRVRDTP